VLERNDPKSWLRNKAAAVALIEEADGDFKNHLDRYKYSNRYDDADPHENRQVGLAFLQKLSANISEHGQIFGQRPCLADHALFPFVRQFANVDRSWFDRQPLSALQKWLGDHLQSELFISIMTKYPQWKVGDEEPVLESCVENRSADSS
jgi:glutathione S-transferase